MTGGKFTLGVGTGEALNEHVLGGPWPDAEERLAMLEEAVELAARIADGYMSVQPDADVYIGQVGGNAEGFFEFYGQQVLPRLRSAG